jgi:hypothetical protein
MCSVHWRELQSADDPKFQSDPYQMKLVSNISALYFSSFSIWISSLNENLPHIKVYFCSEMKFSIHSTVSIWFCVEKWKLNKTISENSHIWKLEKSAKQINFSQNNFNWKSFQTQTEYFLKLRWQFVWW